MTQRHTPLPWEVHPNKTNIFTATPTPNGRIAIATCGVGTRDDEHKPNAAFIVKACNSHYELLEALSIAKIALCHAHSVQGAVIGKRVFEQIDAAIAKATQ